MDTTNLIISALSLVVALGAAGAVTYVGVLTIRQGRVINKIETREHEWEQQDRISAHLEVTRHTVRHATSSSYMLYARIRNTGRAPAHNIVFITGLYVDDPGRELPDGIVEDAEDALTGVLSKVDVIHPGEFIDLPMRLRTYTGQDGIEFKVGWTDARGDHWKTTILNW